MFNLFNRDLTLKIGAQTLAMQLTDPVSRRAYPMLRTVFTVVKTGKKEPNTAVVDVYNLNLPNRKTLQAGADLLTEFEAQGISHEWPLIIEAGYVNTIQQIFSGNVDFVDSHREGNDWMTTFEASDGGKKYSEARLNVTFGPGTTVQILLTTAAAAMGIGLGNSATKFAIAKRGLVLFKKGVTVNGRVSKILNKYINGLGYSWSIQDGTLQVLAPDETLVGTVVVLNKATGLVGSPEVGEKGIVTARSLLQGTIIPGRRVLIESEQVKGFYKAQKVTHTGDTWSQDWYTELEGVPVL